MNTDDFDYELDEKFIAQTPLDKRDESKLMVMDRFNGNTEIKKFYNIIDYLNPGDVLVCNNTRVIPLDTDQEKKKKLRFYFYNKQKISGNVW